MGDWARKRFWKEVRVTPLQGGFGVYLDGRGVHTPSKAPLIMPTRSMAAAVADEWAAQEGQIDPETMPFTRSVNSAIDKVMPQRAAVAAMLAEYGDTDLVCYRATTPTRLMAVQAAAWDPLIDWLAEQFGVRLDPVSGVMHKPQKPECLARLQEAVAALDPFTLTGFHDLVSLSGSLVIGFATLHDQQPADALWRLSRLDEDWQQEQWGADEEATVAAAAKCRAFLHAKRFADLSRDF